MTPVAGDDAADLGAARAGDDDAFGRIYDRHAPVVLSLCRRHAPAEAEDATQETFIRAYRPTSSDPGSTRSPDACARSAAARPGAGPGTRRGSR
ncbi:MAG: RNA polymerase sigma factor [Planctomycetota bacterium]